MMCWPQGKATRRYAGITHINVAELDEGAIASIHELSAQYDVTISGLGYYPNALSCDAAEAEQAVEHIKAVITATSKLGLTRMNTFIGRDWTKSVDDNWPRFLETWKPIIQHAEDQGVKVGIENCPMLFTADEWPGGKNLAGSPAIWRRMFSDIPSDNFGLNYDPSHLVFPAHGLSKARCVTLRTSFFTFMQSRMSVVDQHLLDEVGILAHPNDFHTPKLPGDGRSRLGQVLFDIDECRLPRARLRRSRGPRVRRLRRRL